MARITSQSIGLFISIVWIYIVLYIVRSVPYLGKYFGLATEHFTKFWAKHLFQIQEFYSGPTGSGDGLIQYLHVPSMVFISLLVAITIKLAKHNRISNKGIQVIWIAMRYYLCMILISYGIAKVFPGQFPSLTHFQLERAFGEASPMGIVWRMMQYSRGYQIFTGLSEVFAGILLVLPGFYRIGSLLSIAVMANVFALNIFYNIPVKLFSLHLLLFSILVLYRDLGFLKSLIGETRFPKMRWAQIGYILSFAFIIWCLYSTSTRYLRYMKSRANTVQNEYLRVEYPVESSLDPYMWKQFSYHDSTSMISMQHRDGSHMNLGFRVNAEHTEMKIDRFTFQLEPRDYGYWAVCDDEKIGRIEFKLTKYQHPLLSSKIQWIQEVPTNR